MLTTSGFVFTVSPSSAVASFCDDTFVNITLELVGGAYVCPCTAGFSGSSCGGDVDECALGTAQCSNSRTCNNAFNMSQVHGPPVVGALYEYELPVPFPLGEPQGNFYLNVTALLNFAPKNNQIIVSNNDAQLFELPFRFFFGASALDIECRTVSQVFPLTYDQVLSVTHNGTQPARFNISTHGERGTIDPFACTDVPGVGATFIKLGLEVVAGTYICDCPYPYTGVTCDTLVDECASYPCVHGLCTMTPVGYQCTCSSGASGPTCAVTSGACSGTQQPSTLCGSHGTCLPTFYQKTYSVSSFLPAIYPLSFSFNDASLTPSAVVSLIVELSNANVDDIRIIDSASYVLSSHNVSFTVGNYSQTLFAADAGYCLASNQQGASIPTDQFIASGNKVMLDLSSVLACGLTDPSITVTLNVANAHATQCDCDPG